MPSSPNQRLKLLYLMKILLERTDVQNPLTIAEILSVLDEYGIKAERKSVYSDMELLRHFGIDIETQRSKTVAYYVAERQFELPELKLLVDAVQSSHFISRKNSEGLIKKLSSLKSSAQAKQLRRQVFVADRAKTINETVYYSIDQIHYAINENKQIVFKYFDYDTKKKRVYRKGGEYGDYDGADGANVSLRRDYPDRQFERTILYHRIRIATPRHNGKVERQHRADELRFYSKLRM